MPLACRPGCAGQCYRQHIRDLLRPVADTVRWEPIACYIFLTNEILAPSSLSLTWNGAPVFWV